jgi:hypothetical protein
LFQGCADFCTLLRGTRRKIQNCHNVNHALQLLSSPIRSA